MVPKFKKENTAQTFCGSQINSHITGIILEHVDQFYK
jgi:hypothetical protein